MNLSAGAALLLRCQLMFTGTTVRLVTWTCAAVLGAAVCGRARATDADPQSSPPTEATLSPQAHSVRHPREDAIFERRWGIELIGVHLASAGYMLEFRYRVVDAQRQSRCFSAKPSRFSLTNERDCSSPFPRQPRWVRCAIPIRHCQDERIGCSSPIPERRSRQATW